MLNKLSKFISEKKLFNSNDKLILAVSGGKDSVCLAHLLSQLNYSFSIVHCNFKLRGADSDLDQVFTKELSKKLGVKFYSRSFETLKYAKQNSLSIQMAARELRYQWFEEIRSKNKYSKIITAHHQDDSIETYLIKKSRKSSKGALRGIPLINGKIVRPLLCFSTDEIMQHLQSNNLTFREDRSNASLDYQRNYIRHTIVPKLSKTDVLETIEQNKLDYAHLQEKIKTYQTTIVKNEDVIIFPIANLKTQIHYQELLYECLKFYGPFPWKDVFNLIESQNGRFVRNSNFQLVKERTGLHLSAIEDSCVDLTDISSDTIQITSPIPLQFSIHEAVGFRLTKDNRIAVLDFDKLTFPLHIRRWQNGDSFVPLGMKGRKKVSDFLIDEKFTKKQKDNTFVICSLNEIVCIVGSRISEAYKLVTDTEKVYLVNPLKVEHE